MSEEKSSGMDEFDTVKILGNAHELMITESTGRRNVETGGILLGFIESNSLIVTHASLPGPNAIHKRAYFVRDKKFCQEYLDRIHREFAGKVHYIGEWHKHLELNPSPSRTDINSLTSIAIQPNYEVHRPLLILCGTLDYVRIPRVDIRGFVFDTNGLNREYSGFDILKKSVGDFFEEQEDTQ